MGVVAGAALGGDPQTPVVGHRAAPAQPTEIRCPTSHRASPRAPQERSPTPTFCASPAATSPAPAPIIRSPLPNGSGPSSSGSPVQTPSPRRPSGRAALRPCDPARLDETGPILPSAGRAAPRRYRHWSMRGCDSWPVPRGRRRSYGAAIERTANIRTTWGGALTLRRDAGRLRSPEPVPPGGPFSISRRPPRRSAPRGRPSQRRGLPSKARLAPVTVERTTQPTGKTASSSCSQPTGPHSEDRTSVAS
jgi:hypothetical protein